MYGIAEFLIQKRADARSYQACFKNVLFMRFSLLNRISRLEKALIQDASLSVSDAWVAQHDSFQQQLQRQEIMSSPNPSIAFESSVNQYRKYMRINVTLWTISDQYIDMLVDLTRDSQRSVCHNLMQCRFLLRRRTQ